MPRSVQGGVNSGRATVEWPLSRGVDFNPEVSKNSKPLIFKPWEQEEEWQFVEKTASFRRLQ
jgi:hypothetical protein